jgi:hypothetical protein
MIATAGAGRRSTTSQLSWGLHGDVQLMRKIALLLSFLAAPALAQTYPPQALTFVGYGQSTMEGTVSGDAIGFTASFSGGVMDVTSITGTPLYVGAIISCYNLTINPVTSIQRFGSGVGGRGTYYVNNSDSLGPAACLTSTSTAQTLITPSNINSNAFMIATNPQATVRGMWGTLAPGNSNIKPVLLSNWTGLALLKETVSPYNWNVSNGAIDTETPMSSFVAQFIAQTGFSAPNAVVAENMAHGGEDWVASYPNILAPGGHNDWANFVSAQKFIKNYVQSNATIAGTFAGGPWKYHLGGVIIRLGESAAAAARLVAGARPPSTSSTSFLVTASRRRLATSLSRSLAGASMTLGKALSSATPTRGSARHSHCKRTALPTARRPTQSISLRVTPDSWPS